MDIRHNLYTSTFQDKEPMYNNGYVWNKSCFIIIISNNNYYYYYHHLVWLSLVHDWCRVIIKLSIKSLTSQRAIFSNCFPVSMGSIDPQLQLVWPFVFLFHILAMLTLSSWHLSFFFNLVVMVRRFYKEIFITKELWKYSKSNYAEFCIPTEKDYLCFYKNSTNQTLMLIT